MFFVCTVCMFDGELELILSWVDPGSRPLERNYNLLF